MDNKVLREVIRRRLLTTPLGSASSVVTFGGTPANGEMCDACGMTIFSGQLIIHAVARLISRDRSIQFHVACFEIWNDEKNHLKRSRFPIQPV